ncbi:MAG TPA: cell wall-binding repeat-containing protein [Acidimicrobiales bacterium]|nr:cell wall-binding repeat-containing protein [Acidimicrobiales bacterium]
MRINGRASAAVLGLALVGAVAAVAVPAHADDAGTFTGEPDSLMRVQIFPRSAQVAEPVTVLAAYRLAGLAGPQPPLPLPDPTPPVCAPAGSSPASGPTSTSSTGTASTGTSSGTNTPSGSVVWAGADTLAGVSSTPTATGGAAGSPGGTGATAASPAVSFTVDFGDGTVDTPSPAGGPGVAYAVDSHPYAKAGTYTVTVTADPSSAASSGSPSTGSTSGTSGAPGGTANAPATNDPTGTTSATAGSVVYTATVTVGRPGDTPTASPSASATTTGKQASRIDGTDRYGTDTAISRQEFAPCSATAAVIATADSYKDALSAAPLAAALHAPVFLTDPAQLPQKVQSELTRVVKPGSTVYILGGAAAVGSGIDSTVSGLGYTPQRIAGGSAPATSVAVAQAIQAAGVTIAKVVVGSDSDFPDMTAAAAVAAANQEPVLLTDPQTLSPEVATFLGGLTTKPAVTVIGGTAAVSDAVTKALTALAQSVTRIGGSDRYETAADLAQSAFPDPTSVTIATGTNFPDALAGGPLAASFGGPVLLVPATSVPQSVLSYLSAHAAHIGTTFVLGGTGAVSASVSAEVAGAVGVPASDLD